MLSVSHTHMLLPLYLTVSAAALALSPALRQAQFVSWCAETGVSGIGPGGPMTVDAAGGGSGLFAARDIKEGQQLLSVPLELVLTDQALPGSLHPSVDVSWQSRLAYRLAAEMEEQTTAWRPWLEMLPAAAVGIDERVAKALQYEPAIRTCEELRRSRAAVVAAATDSAAVSCSALEYERCISLAATRAFLVPLPDGSQCHALVPGADLFNHAALEESCAEWSLSATAKNPVMAFRVHARRDVNVGEELTLCYDALRSNDDFAVVYGFVPSANAFDDVDLFVDAAHAIAWHAAAYGSSTEAATATSASTPLSQSAQTSPTKACSAIESPTKTTRRPKMALPTAAASFGAAPSHTARSGSAGRRPPQQRSSTAAYLAWYTVRACGRRHTYSPNREPTSHGKARRTRPTGHGNARAGSTLATRSHAGSSHPGSSGTTTQSSTRGRPRPRR